MVAVAGRSRYPVYVASLDEIVGVVHAKDILRALRQAPGTRVAQIMREPLCVPGTREVEDVLTDMKRLKTHLAVVLDEYGGTAGLVTLEDLLEEIVVEIRDEYDVETEAVVEEVPGTFLVTGKADVHAVAERLGLDIEPEGYETFGGYVLASLGRVPATGEQFQLGTLHVEVVDAERRRLHRLRVRHVVAHTALADPGIGRVGEPQT